MKYKILPWVSVTLLLSSCSDESTNPSYTIQQQGVYFVGERYDVINVYGFGNNLLVTEDIVKYLNKTADLKRQDPYSFYLND
jgi:hypothetical protein